MTVCVHYRADGISRIMPGRKSWRVFKKWNNIPCGTVADVTSQYRMTNTIPLHARAALYGITLTVLGSNSHLNLKTGFVVHVDSSTEISKNLLPFYQLYYCISMVTCGYYYKSPAQQAEATSTWNKASLPHGSWDCVIQPGLWSSEKSICGESQIISSVTCTDQ